MSNNEWSNLLIKWKRIPKVEIKKTAFEITGQAHREIVSSNMLQFYFSDKGHDLDDLFFRSLLEELTDDRFEAKSFKNIVVRTEVTTTEKKRIDLVIETPDYIIGIENKLLSGLYNDLSNYGEYLDQRGNDGRTVYKVVLSLNKLKDKDSKDKIENSNFKNITYGDLFCRIRSNIGDYINNANERYLRILLEYIETIENLTGENMENKEMTTFFQQHKNDLNELVSKYNEHKERVRKKVDDLKEWMPNDEDKDELKLTYHKTWIHTKHCLVYDYLINERTIAIDTKITLDGWAIELFGRNNSSSACSFPYIDDELIKDQRLLDLSGKSEIKKSDNENHKYLIYKNPDVDAIETMGKKLLALLYVLEAIKSEA